MVYISISKFNRTTNCRWWIISSYDGRNILFNAAYVFVVGISSFLQGWIGHRLPIADGPAGSWVGVFTVLAYATAGQDQLHSTLQILELGMIISGVILIGLGVTGFIGRILFLFTPVVTGTFLLLLCLQLSGVF